MLRNVDNSMVQISTFLIFSETQRDSVSLSKDYEIQGGGSKAAAGLLGALVQVGTGVALGDAS